MPDPLSDSQGADPLTPRGLPPPQPIPRAIAEAMEQQQRWGEKRPTSEQVGDIAKKTFVDAPLAELKRENELARRAMTSDDPEEQVRATTGLTLGYMGAPMAGAERAALGAAGGRMIIPSRKDIDVLHASPYNFDKFDISKIGTGEGNTLRGYGLYFGENPSVSGPGGHYDRQFTAQNLGKYELDKTESGILRAIRRGHGDLEIAAALSEQRGMPFDDAARAVDRIRQAKSTIYETKIKAPPHHFVDWDRSLREQSPHVQQGVKKAFGDERLWKRFAEEPAGDVLQRFPEVEAARRLRDVGGVPGFKFLDQYSRQGLSPSKTYNYVVSDDNLLEIMGKMGIAGISALPALGIWHYQGQEDGEEGIQQ